MFGRISRFLFGTATNDDVRRLKRLVEAVARDYIHRKQVFHLQKTQLERGWLTEDILPPEFFGKFICNV